MEKENEPLGVLYLSVLRRIFWRRRSGHAEIILDENSVSEMRKGIGPIM
jgi:hypothetical protein